MNLPGSPTRRELLLLLALGMTVLPAVLLFLKPPANPQVAASAPTVVAAVPAPEAKPEPALDLAEPTTNAEALMLPDRLQQMVSQRRKRGLNLWWADAIEIGWTRGFAAAAEHLRSFVTPDELDDKASDLLSDLAREKLEFLNEGLPLIHEPKYRSRVTSSVIDAWVKKDRSRLVGFAREHFEGEVKNSVFYEVMKVYAKEGSFAQAAALLNEIPRSEMRIRKMESLAGEWGRQDFDRAIEWARALPIEAERLAAEQRAIDAAARGVSLERARELASRYATPQTQAKWDSWIGDKLLAADTGAAIAWADTLPAASRQKLQLRIAIKLAQTDLARGTAYALRIDDESARISATDEIHRQLTQKSRQAAIDWTWTLPEELQHRAVVGIVSEWYLNDEEATKTWVASLPPSRVRDRAVMWLAWRVGRTDPTTAAKLANGINDPQFKEWAFKGTSINPHFAVSGI